jgi:flagellar motor switch protein FliG
MTKRSAERTRDELDTLPPVKVSDVEDRQREVVRIARTMADKKLIVLQSGKHLDEFI